MGNYYQKIYNINDPQIFSNTSSRRKLPERAHHHPRRSTVALYPIGERKDDNNHDMNNWV